MSARARLAFVTIIIIVGCIFAIPNFRHPTGETPETKDQLGESALSLTADDAPQPESLATDAEASTPEDTVAKLAAKPNAVLEAQENEPIREKPSPIALRQDDSLNQHSILMQHPDAAKRAETRTEESKFPPMPRRDLAKTLEPRTFADDSNAGLSWGTEPVAGRDLDPRTSSRWHDNGFEQSEGTRERSASEFSPSYAQPFAQTREQFGGSSDGRIQSLKPQPIFSRQMPSQSQTRYSSTNRPANSRALSPTPMQDAHNRATQQTTEMSWHRVVNGDTLDAIAKQYYGDTRRAINIFEANRGSLYNPAILPIGLELKIPQLP